ncbi:hypothetical protein F25303_11153 [Fusarium sp. NRRL 25303]|nr:hypothetical protein F25303_11153 [Fusarium sp. NRRL 25303]
MPPTSIDNTNHLLTFTNQMPLGLVTEQITAQNLPWHVDEYSSSEYFSNTSSSPELADHAQACYPFNYLSNSTTPPNHDVNMISPTEHSSAMERQIRSPTQMIQVPQMTEIQLRVASRKPKNRRYKVTSNTPAHVRECHHLAEKQYRTRLKAQFETRQVQGKS